MTHHMMMLLVPMMNHIDLLNMMYMSRHQRQTMYRHYTVNRSSVLSHHWYLHNQPNCANEFT